MGTSRGRSSRKRLEVDVAAVLLATGPPGKPERPTARCWHVSDARATRNRNDRARLAERMTFDHHVGSGWVRLSLPENLILAAVNPGATSGHQLSSKQVGDCSALRSERPRNRPRRSVCMTPSALRPNRWHCVRQQRGCAAASERANACPRARLNLRRACWRRRAASHQKDQQGGKARAHRPAIAVHIPSTLANL